MFRRRTSSEPQSSAEAQSPAETQARLDAEAESRSGTKGRATPTRKEAEALRKQRLTPPRDRREAARAAKARARADRDRRRRGLLAGDERALPARDAGPVRAFARDYVDSRRSAAEFFLPGALVVLILSLPRDVTVRAISMYLWLAMMLLIIVDSVILGRGLSRKTRERFPDQPRRGLLPYALMRSMQIRRLRLPPARVKPGDTV